MTSPKMFLDKDAQRAAGLQQDSDDTFPYGSRKQWERYGELTGDRITFDRDTAEVYLGGEYIKVRRISKAGNPYTATVNNYKFIAGVNEDVR